MATPPPAVSSDSHTTVPSGASSDAPRASSPSSRLLEARGVDAREASVAQVGGIPAEGHPTTMEEPGDDESAPLIQRPQRLITVCGGSKRNRQLVKLTPLQRKIAVGAGRALISIADGVLLADSVTNPVVSAAFLAYESYSALRDYYTGAPNQLGLRSTKTDVALRIGLQVGLTATGFAIGAGVAALVGLAALPVVGHVVLCGVLSVMAGVCVSTLVTRYVDRYMIAMQLRLLYNYPKDEQKARVRFEQLLEEHHDLASLEACRVAQHYADYRTACGWESPNDIDDYRATQDLARMPKSLQHFAIVQLQRKWGLTNSRAECRRMLRILMLQHHPDRGGDSTVAAQLNNDFEVYCFCQGWDEAEVFGPTEVVDGVSRTGASRGRGPRYKRNAVVDFIRSIFRTPSNSSAEAEQLREVGLLALEAGAVGNARSLNDTSWDFLDTEEANGVDYCSAVAKQQAVTRALGVVHRRYQMAIEIIVFSGMLTVRQNDCLWQVLRSKVLLFNRLQTFIRCNAARLATSSAVACDAESPGVARHSFEGFSWATEAEALAQREAIRTEILDSCFGKSIATALRDVLQMWSTAKALVDTHVRQLSSEGAGATFSGALGVSASSLTQSPVWDAASPCSALPGGVQLPSKDGCGGSLPDGVGGPGEGFPNSSAAPPSTGVAAERCDRTGNVLDTLLSVERDFDALLLAWESKSQALLADLQLHPVASQASKATGGAECGTEVPTDLASSSAIAMAALVDDIHDIGLTASSSLSGLQAKLGETSAADTVKAFFLQSEGKRAAVESLTEELAGLNVELHAAQQRQLLSRDTASDPSAGREAHWPRAEVQALEAAANDTAVQLLLLHKSFAEVDVVIQELHSAYCYHLPERSSSLGTLPSSLFLLLAAAAGCSGSTTGSAATATTMTRVVPYELERTILSYSKITPEAHSAAKQARTTAVTVSLAGAEADAGGGCSTVLDGSLLLAMYNDPLTGTMHPCWLKCYSLSTTLAQLRGGAESVAAKENIRGDAAPLMLQEAVDLLSHLIWRELRLAARCNSRRVTVPVNFFTEASQECVYFHIPRSSTQQRFLSTADIRRRVLRLGIRWLHGALNALMDLHECGTAHGDVRLSNFTYDDFGNTALGHFGFGSVAGGASLADLTGAFTREGPLRSPPGPAVEADAFQFGIMLHTEVIPFIQEESSRDRAELARSAATPRKVASYEDQRNDALHVFIEVADRLIGKLPPRWTLLEARRLVRKFICYHLDTDEGKFTFTKEVTLPPYWGHLNTKLPVMQTPYARCTLPLAVEHRVFLNCNTHLWERYWRCRRQLMLFGHHRGAEATSSGTKAKEHRVSSHGFGGTYSLSAQVRSLPPIVLCHDDCEVNERYMWQDCDGGEEQAWTICQRGVAGSESGTAHLLFCVPTALRHPMDAATPPPTSPRPVPTRWAVLCRVALGTVVDSETLGNAAPRLESSGPGESETEGIVGGSGSGRADGVITSDLIAADATREILCAVDVYAERAKSCDGSHIDRPDPKPCWAVRVPTAVSRCYPEYVVQYRPRAAD